MDHERKDVHTTLDAAKEGALICCLTITNVFLLLFYFILGPAARHVGS